MSPRLILWLAVVIPLSLVLITLSRLGALDPVENVAMTVSSPVARAFRSALGPLADWGRYDQIRDENQRLRQENQRLLAEIARLREKESALQDLAQLLKMQEERPDDQFILANVIAYDSSNIKDAIAIDKGRRYGLTEGMAVLGEGGALVGTVIQVYRDFAWVALISDPASSVNAVTVESRVMGVVSGSVDGRLRLEFVPQGADVQPGDLVVTSGLGGNYPKSLLIGRITSVGGSQQDPFRQVYLEPAAHLPRLERVVVLLSFQPIHVTQP